ncbi:MAG: site-specific integrase [Solirubrobacterales bacterium]|nr:site-specific integrase [Solirubrobacterales bacterium]
MVPFMLAQVPRSVLLIRDHNGSPFYEVKWHSPAQSGRQVKRRLGPAWLDRDPSGEGWVKRRGRVVAGYWDPRTAPGGADELVGRVEAELALEERRRGVVEEAPLTFRELAHEWIADLAREAKPSTMRDYESLLREPGTPHKRGPGASEGRIMAAFGDADVRAITSRQVAEFLRGLEEAGFKPRNVNKYRQVLATVYSWGRRAENHELPSNPVEAVSKRKEGPVGGFDYYEVHEAEQLADALATGAHRPQRDVDDAEAVARAVEDAQDAEMVRVLFYVGLRLGEARALRWADVDLEGRMIHVARAISAGVEVSTPKGGRARWVPLATPALKALLRQAGRPDFSDDEDFVFGSRAGGVLDESAFRRRYEAARDAAELRPLKLKALRNAAGSIAARSATAVEVRDLLGHAKLSTTDRYVAARWSQEFMDRMDAAFMPRAVREQPAPGQTD